jgi:hypothetical protein
VADGCQVSCKASRHIMSADSLRFDFALATLESRQRNHEVSEALFMDAQVKWLTNNDIRTDPFCGLVVYKLGCAALAEGKIEAAM